MRIYVPEIKQDSTCTLRNWSYELRTTSESKNVHDSKAWACFNFKHTFK